MEKKQCSKCKEWKEFKYFHKDKSKKDGLRYECKECTKKYREKNSERIEKRLIKLKNLEMNKRECSKCKELKDLNDFGKNKHKKDGLQTQCKDCRSKYRKKRYENNKEKELKQSKKWSEEHEEYHSKYNKEYYQEHKPNIDKINKQYRYSPMNFNLKTKYRQEIELYEKEIRESADGYLECKCAYCGDWFKPTYLNVQNRLGAINNNNRGEGRLYCSDACKQACPTYGQQLYHRDFKPATSREVQPELRQMVLARDNYTCQRCDKTKDELSEEEIALHCHHLEGIQWEPLMSADMDMCITYCQPCHVKAHQTPGCGYHDMQCIY